MGLLADGEALLAGCTSLRSSHNCPRPTGQKFKRRQRAVDSGRREDDRVDQGEEYFNVSGQQVESTQRYAWSADMRTATHKNCMMVRTFSESTSVVAVAICGQNGMISMW
jgi:hypothetical protein